MINLNDFIKEMADKLKLEKTDIIENIDDINDVDNYIASLDDNIKNKLSNIFEELIKDDFNINNMLNNFEPDAEISKNFKIALAKLQFKTFLNKYITVLNNEKLIKAINVKINAVLETIRGNLNNKYYVYYKYIKYKNKYLQLKYNYI